MRLIFTLSPEGRLHSSGDHRIFQDLCPGEGTNCAEIQAVHGVDREIEEWRRHQLRENENDEGYHGGTELEREGFPGLDGISVW